MKVLSMVAVGEGEEEIGWRVRVRDPDGEVSGPPSYVAAYTQPWVGVVPRYPFLLSVVLTVGFCEATRFFASQWRSRATPKRVEWRTGKKRSDRY